MRPTANEADPYFFRYIDLVPEVDVMPVLMEQFQTTVTRWLAIPASQAMVIHAPYLWTIHQVLRHVCDGERIFGYRMLCIARNDKTPLPSFDEDHYAKISETHPVPINAVVEEFSALRHANILLLKSLPECAWKNQGVSSNANITVNAIAFILAGHVRHHDAILRRRLGQD